MPETTPDRVDAVVIGAGFSGLYMLHKLRDDLGLAVRVFETGGNVGGTWYWNRYPGARCDSDSYIYCYSFDKDLWQEWEWSERYPEAPEIRSYLEHVTERFDLARDIQFNTKVTAAAFDEDTGRWTITTDTGETVTAQYLISAVGSLSAVNTPKFNGIDSFRGDSYHTGNWPHEGVDFTGQRVGVIGTGASAVQSIPLIAQQAADLTVFQRTANYIVPANNGPVPEEVRRARKADYEGIRERLRSSYFGFELYFEEKGALETPPKERYLALQQRWDEGGFGIWLGSYGDIFFVDEANEKVREFLHDRIREKVHDPETAELLIPKGYPFGCKRNPLDSGYFETFNRDNVHLVDVKATPIAEITPAGVRLDDGTEYEFDAIVYATGFDAMTGPLSRIDVRGRGGRLIREKWAEGPKTYLGPDEPRLPEPVHHHRPAEPLGAVQHAGLDRAARGVHRPDHRRHARARRRAHRADQAGRGRLGCACGRAGRRHPVPDGGHLVHGRQHPRQAAGVPAQPRLCRPLPGQVRRGRRTRLRGLHLQRRTAA